MVQEVLREELDKKKREEEENNEGQLSRLWKLLNQKRLVHDIDSSLDKILFQNIRYI